MFSMAIIAIIITLDQFLKIQIVKKVMPYNSIKVIKGIFQITYVENYGIAFGLFKNKGTFFIFTTSIIILILLYFIYITRSSLFLNGCLSMIVGGALGNLLDRIRLGYVIDYLHFTFFPPVFNFADAAIVCGAFLLSIYLYFDKSISF